jgi:hypothetical protein
MSYVTPPDNLTDAMIAIGKRSEPASQLPLYVCHKEVRAIKISEVERVAPFDHGGTALSGEGLTVEVDEAWLKKHSPDYDGNPLSSLLGGYYVVYADGYKSFSPAVAFEEGYTRI